MDRLHTQYQRLYQPAATDIDSEHASGLIGQSGRVRALVLALRGPANWSELSAVWRGVQTDLGWPAPAIAVNGVDAFELWFSLAEAVPVEAAAAVLQGMRERYLAEVKPARVRAWPTVDGAPWSAARIPALQEATRGWSAFVAPDLPAVFGDEPLLDFQPGDVAQAELLGRLASVRPAEWQAALALLSVPAARAALVSVAVPASAPPTGPTQAALKGPYQDPRSFLLDVMNDPSVALELRIKAAKALLIP